MDESLHWVLACAAGFALGLAFFAGLWWTVRLCLSSRHSALWVLASQLVRTALLLIGFYFIADGLWPRLLACVLGFVTAKLVTTRLASAPQGARHAP